ncbi:MAG: dimethyl sulfoxide reductase anchor subunit [Eggerthellaceae bacterium]|nr:dimethyl sulfoxide reductase anchor subunit [Eggerthellaceae bacterium]
MLFENASAELALLLFTLLVPVGVMALALMACVRGFFATDAKGARTADRLTSIPAVVMLVGLVCSFFHLGDPGHVFGMLTGIGHSPLSNEILVAAIAIVIGVVYWVICLVKGLNEGGHKVFGTVLLVAAVVCAVFTGTAYAIPTIPTWDTPCNWIGQLGLALLGGSALAAASLALAGYELDKQASLALKACGGIGLVVVAAVLVAQAALSAAAVSSVGVLLGSVMTDYATVGAACVVLCAAGYALFACGRVRVVPAWLGVVCVMVGLALMRVDFYGVFLSAGLAYL